MNTDARSFKRLVLPTTLAISLLLSACANMSAEQKGTATGAGIGVAAGAVLGGLIGGRDGATTGALLGGAAGAVGGNIWSKKMEAKRQAMEQATQGTGVEVARTADNQLKLQVPSDISFDTGRADLKPELRTVLEHFGNGLSNDPSLRVRVVGHTDSTGNDTINDKLSVERANSVRNFLVDRGISPGRIEAAGRGSHEPIADNASAENRAKNRRVEIFLREQDKPA
ncbi:OmpA family protein [Roseateles sp. PN1]|uniref:OmpA family protein n=1 Tax=Roseateles sp. PN1 TaxID=3137372 RepID=UPI0031389761